jgi:hypothetical protein
MSKSTREKSLRYLALLAACVAASNACDRPEYSYSDDVPIKGGSSVGGTGFTTAGAIAFGGSTTIDPCALDRSVGASPVLAKQVVSHGLAGRAELYAEVTDSEVQALKQGGSLIPPAPATVPGTATPLTVVLTATLAAVDSRGALAKLLLNRFKATRSTWPNPWALRLVDHAGTEHMTPLRIRLRDDAWIVRIDGGSVAVIDVQNGSIGVDAALAHPERIAAVYYVYDDRTTPAVAQCESGKREFALGNEAMVAEFSLGTSEILSRLNSDIDDLTKLFDVVRQCTTVDRGGGTFHSSTVCQAWDFFDATTEYSAYQWSLSNPVELYKPTTQNLASLVDALKNDRFEPDPFVVAREAPLGMGGAGGASELGEGGLAQGGVGGLGGASGAP